MIFKCRSFACLRDWFEMNLYANVRKSGRIIQRRKIYLNETEVASIVCVHWTLLLWQVTRKRRTTSVPCETTRTDYVLREENARVTEMFQAVCLHKRTFHREFKIDLRPENVRLNRPTKSCVFWRANGIRIPITVIISHKEVPDLGIFYRICPCSTSVDHERKISLLGGVLKAVHDKRAKW
jgi:hypothetical protein